MAKLSEQLGELSTRAKQTEDVAAAARAKDRARLEAQQAELKTSLATGRANVGAKLTGVRAAVEEHFTAIRADAEQHRYERDVKRAEHRADQAEQDAADSIVFALYVLDEADNAIIDAILARADADGLAAEA